MKVAVFSAKRYEREFLEAANRAGTGEHAGGGGARAPHELVYVEARLTRETAALAAGCGAVCMFVTDEAPAEVLATLSGLGVRGLALRSAGFNTVDIEAAQRLGMMVARVPAYSPHAVAEHAVALILALNRHIVKAAARVREQNFALDGLMGFDLRGKTVGAVGTGRIGEAFCRIMLGFGCRVLAVDPMPMAALREAGVTYVEMEAMLRASDIVALHCPLTPRTKHLIDDRAFAMMKPGAMLINTSRGGVVDTRALIAALKRGSLGSVGLDVYEEEADLFFRDLSDAVIQDDVFARLMTFPNVLITAHQAFFTREAMTNIAETTMANLDGIERGSVPTENLVVAAKHVAPAARA
jgi:D-lactate dehydrogenase